MVNAREISRLHDRWTRVWHEEEPHFKSAPADFGNALEQEHYANFQLWHEEDKARAPHASDAEIAEVKRTIDQINQHRNDLMEQCDVLALAELTKQGLPSPDAPLHTESVGLIIDRLSILSLKIYHTREEIERVNAPEGHAQRNRARLATLEEQRDELAGALDALWADVLAGRRRFRVYRQLKMYNEAALNPAVYKAMRNQ
jgi:uncharacterized protein DUF4254